MPTSYTQYIKILPRYIPFKISTMSIENAPTCKMCGDDCRKNDLCGHGVADGVCCICHECRHEAGEEEESDEEEFEDMCDCCVKGWDKENEFGRCHCICSRCDDLLRVCKYTCLDK